MLRAHGDGSAVLAAGGSASMELRDCVVAGTVTDVGLFRPLVGIEVPPVIISLLSMLYTYVYCHDRIPPSTPPALTTHSPGPCEQTSFRAF